jgi:hypothetical protein
MNDYEPIDDDFTLGQVSGLTLVRQKLDRHTVSVSRLTLVKKSDGLTFFVAKGTEEERGKSVILMRV